MINREERYYQSVPIISASVFLIAALMFSWSRDFGVFLLGMFVLPITLLFALGCLIFGVFRKARAVELRVAVALILAAPVLAFGVANIRDRLRFLFWAPIHYSQLHQALRKDGIITAWDGWGMAGMENDSYLVVDNKDEIKSPVLADQWRKRLGQSCEIVNTQRMWPRLYIVTTSNCTFDGVEPTN
jgi:hypothetical protein